MTEMHDGDVIAPDEWALCSQWTIAVSRRKRRIVVWRRYPSTQPRWGCVRVIKCAVGMPGHTTPKGVFSVMNKAQNPDWQKPRSEWVPESQWGEVISGSDPANPIKAAFLKLTDDGVGIHGTADLPSLGFARSHGCIRVSPTDALWLYRHIPVGTQVHVS